MEKQEVLNVNERVSLFLPYLSGMQITSSLLRAMLLSMASLALPYVFRTISYTAGFLEKKIMELKILCSDFFRHLSETFITL